MSEIATPHSTITQVLEEFGREMQTELRAQLVKDKAYVSGDLAEQIDFTAVVNGQGYLFQRKLKD